MRRFGKTDITTMETKHYHQYLDWVQQQDASLTPATLNHIASVSAKVMKLSRQEGIIDFVPATPRVKQLDCTRPFFRFSPLVDREHDEYKKLLDAAIAMADGKTSGHGDNIVTDELYDFILFMTHSFLRPTESEIYALTHRDIAVATDPKRLIITIRKGKTGHRIINTMPAAV